MSINDKIHYEMYRVSDVTPEWVKNERYEYCEDFYGSILQRGKGTFKRFIMKLQAFMF